MGSMICPERPGPAAECLSWLPNLRRGKGVKGVTLPLPTEKPKGVSVFFLVNEFEKQVKTVCSQYNETTTFEELDAWIWGSYDDRKEAGGPVNVVDLFGHKTMRKGGASLCDAIGRKSPGSVGDATIFINWAWRYRVWDFVYALGWYCELQKLDPQKTFCCICFFNSIQHVWFQPGGVSNAVEIFESNVRMVGTVAVVLDTLDARRSIYFSRLWTIFEVYIAIRNELQIVIAPMNVAYDETHTFLLRASSERDEVVFANHVRKLMKVDMAAASASTPQDADSIRRQVGRLGGDQAMTDAVVKAFATSLDLAQLLQDYL
mmetsp:Transcript_71658/g.164237  ORF Transcript_71658/g.164237 Transcript_71658/m.164237 type:complete len:318 (+) Transcript_71658:189-1142(+)